MKIKVVAVSDAELKTSAKGKAYSMIEVTFKNLDKNTTQSKKLMSFDKKLYELFQASHSGDIYDVSVVKSDDDKFWNWSDATKGSDNGVVNGVAPTSTSRQSSYKNYNDDSRQISIIRQSTLKMAVDWVTATGGDPTMDAVYRTAKEFQDYVMNPETFGIDTVEETEEVE